MRTRKCNYVAIKIYEMSTEAVVALVTSAADVGSAVTADSAIVWGGGRHKRQTIMPCWLLQPNSELLFCIITDGLGIV